MKRAVYPFKEGDKVECLNAAGVPLTEGRVYEVRSVQREDSGSGFTDDVVVTDDKGDVRSYLAVRFCAPGEGRTLRTRIAPVAPGLRDELAEAKRDLAAVAARRDTWRKRAEAAEATVRHQERAIAVLKHEAGVRTVGVLHDGAVVLTK